ncbi:MAG: RecX family transcriptional regulator [Ignavibacteriales bacterium]
MVITDIKKNKGKSYSVYIDNGDTFGVSEYILMKQDIHIGMELSEKELDFIKNQVLISMSKSDAINFVSYKMRTAYEVEIKLKEKYPLEIIQEVIDYLNQNDYLNDEMYAERFINEKKKLGKLSKKELVYKLMEKGIKRELIEIMIEKNEYDEIGYAKKVIAKRGKTKDKKEEAKAINYLYRKGFSKDTIDEIIKEKRN